jgi:hypothetical protein
MFNTPARRLMLFGSVTCVETTEGLPPIRAVGAEGGVVVVPDTTGLTTGGGTGKTRGKTRGGVTTAGGITGAVSPALGVGGSAGVTVTAVEAVPEPRRFTARISIE